jgi:hypothetical protein
MHYSTCVGADALPSTSPTWARTEHFRPKRVRGWSKAWLLNEFAGGRTSLGCRCATASEKIYLNRLERR